MYIDAYVALVLCKVYWGNNIGYSRVIGSSGTEAVVMGSHSHLSAQDV